MNVINIAYWNRVAQNPRNKEIVEFAKDWANAMEKKLNAGQKLADIAQETSHLPSGRYLSGAAFGLALTYLINAWSLGEELRRWHNKEFGMPGANEIPGAVVNPALTNVINVQKKYIPTDGLLKKIWNTLTSPFIYSNNIVFRALRGFCNVFRAEKI